MDDDEDFDVEAITAGFQRSIRGVLRCHLYLGASVTWATPQGVLITDLPNEVYLKEHEEDDRKYVSERQEWEAFFSVHPDNGRREEIMSRLAMEES